MKLVVALAALLVGASSLGSEFPAPEDACDGPKLWEAMIRAKGGREALYRVETLLIVRKERATLANLGQIDYSYDVLAIPDSWWRFTGTRGKRPHVSWEDHRKMEDGTTRGRHVFHGRISGLSMLEDELVQYLGEAREWKPAIGPCRVSQRGRELTVMGRRGRYVYLFPPDEDLPTQVILGKSPGYEFSGVTEVAGLRLPSRTRMFYPLADSRERGEWMDVTYEMNPKVDPKLRETPSDVTWGPFRWRLPAMP